MIRKALNELTFEDDKLDREQYAKAIINIIDQSDDLRDVDNSFVMALDAPWGMGKSSFAYMLKNKLENDKPRIKTVIYNAWEFDYLTDAFEPLIYSLMHSEILQFQLSEEGTKELIRSIPRIISAFAKDKVEEVLGKSACDEIINTKNCFEEVIFDKQYCFAKINDKAEGIQQFKTTVNKELEQSKNIDKILIIIDELDRCKPTFAVETLEVLKHIFNIPNVCFLLTVDFDQLKHSVQTIYGSGIDGEGYLLRFINHKIKLPEEKRDKYIDHITEKSDRCDYHDDIASLLNYSGLSLRDIDRIYQDYSIVLKAYFDETKANELDASLPCLILIMCKYVDSDMYRDILWRKNENRNNADSSIYQHLQKGNNRTYLSFLKEPSYSDYRVVFTSSQKRSEREEIIIENLYHKWKSLYRFFKEKESTPIAELAQKIIEIV
ncbi:MAG: P-loop NTPase fold protein [Oscillospiraceae bacterium]|nr:P-loop NTPase fold protein [Oscillospiraceae bacterium]